MQMWFGPIHRFLKRAVEHGDRERKCKMITWHLCHVWNKYDSMKAWEDIMDINNGDRWKCSYTKYMWNFNIFIDDKSWCCALFPLNSSHPYSIHFVKLFNKSKQKSSLSQSQRLPSEDYVWVEYMCHPWPWGGACCALHLSMRFTEMSMKNHTFGFKIPFIPINTTTN